MRGVTRVPRQVKKKLTKDLSIYTQNLKNKRDVFKIITGENVRYENEKEDPK